MKRSKIILIIGLLFPFSLVCQQQRSTGLGGYVGGFVRQQYRYAVIMERQKGGEFGLLFKRYRREERRITEVNVGVDYSTYRFRSESETDTYNYHEKLWMLGVTVRNHWRFFEKERFSCYFGLGLNLETIASYKRRYDAFFENGSLKSSAWSSTPDEMLLLGGANASLSFDYWLRDRLKLNFELNAIAKLNIGLTSSETFGSQNLRISLLRILN